jgi:mono/diheme cytochrome c family protein
MSRRRSAFVAGLITIAGAVWVGGSPTAAQSERAASDGAYTDAQAKRGEVTYQEACAYCHMPDLRGEGFAPALVDDAFSARWKGRTVGELFIILKGTMPADDPDSLTDAQYAELVAFLLKENEYPASEDDLSADPAVLKQLMFKTP